MIAHISPTHAPHSMTASPHHTRLPRIVILCVIVAIVAASTTVLASTTVFSSTTVLAAPSTSSASIDARFPAFPLDAFDAAQKQQFVRVAESELCPCEGSTDSLATCFEADDVTCGLARDAGRALYAGVKERAPDTVISKRIAKAIQTAQATHTFPLDDAPWRGADKPSVTMVIFADFQCPYCHRMAQMADQLLSAHPNDLRVYFLQFPLAGHSNATDAAIASIAAQKQGKFWAYHDKLFKEQRTLSAAIDAMPILLQWAESLALDTEKFKEDMNDSAIYARVRAEKASGRTANVRGTPAVFLNGVAFSDIGSYAAIQTKVQSLIKDNAP